MASNISVNINANIADLQAQLAVAEAGAKKTFASIRSDARSVANVFDAVKFDRIAQNTALFNQQAAAAAALKAQILDLQRAFESLQASPRKITNTSTQQIIAAAVTAPETGASDQARADARETAQAAFGAGGAFDKLRASIVPAFAAEMQFEVAVARADKALQKGAASASEYSARLEVLKSQLAAVAAEQIKAGTLPRPTDASSPLGQVWDRAQTIISNDRQRERDRLRAATVPLAGAEQEFTKGIAEADEALRQGALDFGDYIARLDVVKERLTQTAAEAIKFGAAIRPTNTTSPLGQVWGDAEKRAQNQVRGRFDPIFRAREAARKDLVDINRLGPEGFGGGAEGQQAQGHAILDAYRRQFDEVRRAKELSQISPEAATAEGATIAGGFNKQVAAMGIVLNAHQKLDGGMRLNRQGLLELQAAGINAFQAMAAGMSPLHVAMMEGAQVVGSVFQGGLISFSRALEMLASPIAATVARFGGLAGAVAYVGVASYQTSQNTRQLSAASAIRGQGRSELDTPRAIQRDEAKLVRDLDLGRSQASELTTSFANANPTLRARRPELERLTVAYSAATHTDLGEAQKMFGSAAEGGASGLLKLAEGLNINGPLWRRHINDLIEAGQSERAVGETIKALSDRFLEQGTAVQRAGQSYGWMTTALSTGFNPVSMLMRTITGTVSRVIGRDQVDPQKMTPEVDPAIRAGEDVAARVTPEMSKRTQLQEQYVTALKAEVALTAAIERLKAEGQPVPKDLTDAQVAVGESIKNLRAEEKPRGAGEQRQDESQMAQTQARLQMAEQAAATEISKQQEVLDVRRTQLAEITRIHKQFLDAQGDASKVASQQEIQYRQETLDRIRQMYRERLDETTFQTSTLAKARDPLNPLVQLQETQRERATAYNSGTAYTRQDRQEKDLEVIRLQQEADRFNIERGLFQTATLPAAIQPQNPYAQLQAAQQRFTQTKANEPLFGKPAVEQAQLGVISALRQTREYELQINQARIQGQATLAEARGDLAAIVDLRRQELALIEADPDKNSLQKLQAKNTLMSAQLNALRQSRDMANQLVQAQNSFDSRRLQTNISLLNLSAEIGDIRPSQAIRQEGVLTRQTMAVQEQRLQARAAALDADPNASVEERAGINQELASLYEEDAQKQIEIQIRLTQAIRAENERRLENIKDFFKTIESSATSAFAGVLTRQKKFADAFKDFRQSVVTSLITNVESMLSKAAGKGLASATGIKLKEGEDTSVSAVLSKVLGNAIGLTEPEPKTDQASISQKMQQAADANQKAVNIFAQAVDKFAAAGQGAPLNAGRGQPDTGGAVGTPSAESRAAGGGVASGAPLNAGRGQPDLGASVGTPSAEARSAGVGGGSAPAVPRVYETDNAIGLTARNTTVGLPALKATAAAAGVYGVPGAIMNYGGTGALGSQAEAAKNLVTVTTASGAKFQVHKDAAPAFQGFLDELEGGGYKINPSESGGYSNREKAGGHGLSEHAFGTAIDINPSRNPFRSSQTDLPPDISDMAARHGLIWGGNWKDPKDTMHFQWGGPGSVQTTAQQQPQIASVQPSSRIADPSYSRYDPSTGTAIVLGRRVTYPPGAFLTGSLPQISHDNSFAEYNYLTQRLSAPNFGYSDPRNMAPTIRESAQKYGHNPDIAVEVANQMALGSFYTNRYEAGGAFELYTGRGSTEFARGNQFNKETGLNPLDPKNEAAGIDWVMRNLSKTGWDSTYYGAATIGIGRWEGVNRNPPSMGVSPSPVAHEPVIAVASPPPRSSDLTGYDPVARRKLDLIEGRSDDSSNSSPLSGLSASIPQNDSAIASSNRSGVRLADNPRNMMAPRGDPNWDWTGGPQILKYPGPGNARTDLSPGQMTFNRAQNDAILRGEDFGDWSPAWATSATAAGQELGNAGQSSGAAAAPAVPPIPQSNAGGALEAEPLSAYSMKLEPETLSDLLRKAQPRYGQVSGGADLMADMKSAYGNVGFSTMTTALRIKSGLGDEQLKPLVTQANQAIQAAHPGLDIESAFKSGKPSLDELLKIQVPEEKRPEAAAAQQKSSEKAPEKASADTGTQALQASAQQSSAAMTQLTLAATTAGSSVTQIGQSATTASTSLDEAGTSASTINSSLQTISTDSSTLGSNLTQAGTQAQEAGQQFAQAGQSASQAGQGSGGSSGSSGSRDDFGGGASTSKSSGGMLSGIGELASVATSISALTGTKMSPIIRQITAGVSLISSISKMFSGGGLFGGLLGGGGAAAGASGGGGSMFGGGGSMFGGIGSLFTGLFSLFALDKGGIIPSAAGGMIVQHSLPAPIKSGIRALANDNRAGLFGGGRLIKHARGDLGVNDGKGGRLIVAHPNEMVVPAAETRVILDAMRGGGMIPSAEGGMVVAANSNYRLPLSAVSNGMLSGPHPGDVNLPGSISQGLQAAVGGARGGDTHQYSINVSAIDSRSGAQFLMSNADHIASALGRARRNFNASGR